VGSVFLDGPRDQDASFARASQSVRVVLCVLLILFAGFAQANHVHPTKANSPSHECSVCSVAHASAIVKTAYRAVPVFRRSILVQARGGFSKTSTLRLFSSTSDLRRQSRTVADPRTCFLTDFLHSTEERRDAFYSHFRIFPSFFFWVLVTGNPIACAIWRQFHLGPRAQSWIPPARWCRTQTVEIHNPVSQFSRTATTDSNGNFSIPNVPFNPYHLSVLGSWLCAPMGQDCRTSAPWFPSASRRH